MHVCKKSSIFVQIFVNMRYFISILLLLSVVLVGCNKNKETVVTSSEARVKTFSFYADTLNPGLTAVNYKIEHSGDTGLIYNSDSLRFGTRLDSVVPYVTYMATPGKATFILADTTIVSSGTDTMNLQDGPVYLHVVSSDMENEQWYRIQLTVHQVDPDLYVWSQLTQQIFAPQHCETKAFWIDGKFVMYVNNGFGTILYTSSDGVNWSKAGVPTVLPKMCYVREILQHNSTLYYIDNGVVYQSNNYIDWLTTDYSSEAYRPISMLMAFEDQPWCIVEDTATQHMYLAVINDNTIQLKTDIQGLSNGVLPEDFPINDFAALAFESSSERPRAMVVGGRNRKGEAVNTRWNIEYDITAGYRMKNFSIEQPNFNSLTGISIIQYDKHLIMFGGIDNDMVWRSDMLFSDDEGMNWYIPDTAHNQLPDTYQTRQKQSVMVDDDKNIYIIGGQGKSQTFSDVYRGYLNSINW